MSRFSFKMKSSYFIVIFVPLILANQAEDGSLKLVHVFFRHGARTPERKALYPNDPFKEDDFLPTGLGQLTNEGKYLSYTLGKQLRKRYNSFIGDSFPQNLVYVQSTDYDRTKMTAMLVLAGLFPPSSTQVWNEELRWLPIPVAYEKHQNDYFLKRPNDYCPAYMKVLQEVLHSNETLDYIKSNKATFDILNEHVGKPVKKLGDVFDLFQTLTAENVMNFTLPEWTKTVFPGEITKLAIKQSELENCKPILRRLNGGRSLQKVLANILAKTTNTLTPRDTKIFLYSGHENNVINILATLNLYKPHVPNYNAAVIIELHYLKDKKEYAIKVLYVRDVNKVAEEKQIDGCEIMCPLKKFIEITKPVTPVNYTEECNSHINLD